METIYLNNLNAESIIEWIKANPQEDLNFTHFNIKGNWGRDAVVSIVAKNTTMNQWLKKDKFYEEFAEAYQKRIRQFNDVTIYHSQYLDYYEINNNIYYCTF